MGSPTIPAGLFTPWSTWGKFGQIDFIIRQILASVQTATLVKVLSCTNTGGVSPFGLVDVVPMVNQIDAAGNSQPHSTIFNIPYLRLQGGANAVILDPQAGDIGIAVFANRDISKVKNTQAQGDPGSARQFDYSDGLYLGGLLNGVPTQYIRFSSAGISIVSPDTVTIQAPTIALQGSVTISEGLTVTDDVTAGPNLISLENHIHTSEAPGDPTSPPLP